MTNGRFRPHAAESSPRVGASAVSRCILAALLLIGAAGPAVMLAQARPPARKPAPTRAPAKSPPPATSPKFDVSLTSRETAPDRRAVLVVFSDGDGDVVWGRAGADRSILRFAVRDARVLAQRLGDYARRAIVTRCGTLPETTPPTPLVYQQQRLAMLRTFAIGCAVQGDDPGLVFTIADSTATAPGTIGPVLVEPWEVACSALVAFTDSMDAALSVGDNAGRRAPAAGTCPQVFSESTLRQLATRLLGDSGDSVAVVLADVGPRAVAPVIDIALGDPYPVARARAARVLETILQAPLGAAFDPDAYVVPLARRWRDERDRSVADTVGRALGRLIANNPGRIRTLDTLLQVVRERLPILAERTRALTPADVDRGAPDAAPLARALELVAALRDAAGPLVASLTDLGGEYGSAADVLTARTIGTLGPLASAAAPMLRTMVEQPTPQRAGPRTAATFAEGVAVATDAARALALTGAAGRDDVLALWRAHETAPRLDTLVLSPPAPRDTAAADSAAAPRVPFDTAARSVEAAWGTDAARARPLEAELHRAALVAGLATACAADESPVGPLGRAAGEPLAFAVAPPETDDVLRVVRVLREQRERTRIAAVEALGDCGPRARSQLDVLFTLANAAPDDPHVSDALRRAANRAIPRVRRIE